MTKRIDVKLEDGEQNVAFNTLGAYTVGAYVVKASVITCDGHSDQVELTLLQPRITIDVPPGKGVEWLKSVLDVEAVGEPKEVL